MPRKLKVEWAEDSYDDDGSVYCYVARVGELTLRAWDYCFEVLWIIPRRHDKVLTYRNDLGGFGASKRAAIAAAKTHLDWHEWKAAKGE